MKNVSKTTLLGYVGRDPAFRTLPNGELVAKFSMATTIQWKNKKTDEWEEETEWHNVEAFKHLAERVKRDIRKGSPVYVNGRIKTERWKDPKTGEDRQQKIIRAADLTLVGTRQRPDSAPKGESPADNEEDSAF